MPESTPLRAGVVGVGAMGENHARVYRELPETQLVGVYDADQSRATEVATTYAADVYAMGDLLDRVDVVSVAVPTEYHYETVRECIDAGVHVLVEKPFVADPVDGRRLVEFADERDVVLQVGHIERFNPATRRLMDLVADLDVIAVDARRLGPPVDRDIQDTAVMDLMIHDIDILLALVDEAVSSVDAIGNQGGRYAAANLQFESGVVGQLTASRVTQEKVRRLSLSAENCRVKVDFIDQSIEIHRQSFPEYVEDDGDVYYHHENIVERLTVEKREPLKNELSSFAETARDGGEPVVTGEDALRALELTRTVDDLATASTETAPDPVVRRH